MRINSCFYYLFIYAVLILSFSGCDEEKEPPTQETKSGITITTSGKLTFHLNHVFGNQPLKFSPDSFVTKANDTIKITDLLYYITNVTFTKPDGSTWNAGNHDLINAAHNETVVIQNIPAGNYTHITFLVGVDTLNNHTLNHNEPDLDPTLGMSWGWNTGYIFFRMKGFYSSLSKGFSFDLGGDANLMSLTYDLSSYKLSKDQISADFKVDANKFFENPNTYDLKTQLNNIHTPTDSEILLFTANIKNGMFNLTALY